MSGLIISKENLDVKTTTIRQRSFDSDTNQWKIHRSVAIAFTAPNQTKTLEHGLGYTPAFISFQRVSGDAYYTWAPINDYVDTSQVSFLGQSGDLRSFLIFKDFGR